MKFPPYLSKKKNIFQEKRAIFPRIWRLNNRKFCNASTLKGLVLLGFLFQKFKGGLLWFLYLWGPLCWELNFDELAIHWTFYQLINKKTVYVISINSYKLQLYFTLFSFHLYSKRGSLDFQELPLTSRSCKNVLKESWPWKANF